jgi:hypothetical protein
VKYFSLWKVAHRFQDAQLHFEVDVAFSFEKEKKLAKDSIAVPETIELGNILPPISINALFDNKQQWGDQKLRPREQTLKLIVDSQPLPLWLKTRSAAPPPRPLPHCCCWSP